MKNIDELLGVAKLSELMSNDKKDESKKVMIFHCLFRLMRKAAP